MRITTSLLALLAPGKTIKFVMTCLMIGFMLQFLCIFFFFFYDSLVYSSLSSPITLQSCWGTTNKNNYGIFSFQLVLFSAAL